MIEIPVWLAVLGVISVILLVVVAVGVGLFLNALVKALQR